MKQLSDWDASQKEYSLWLMEYGVPLTMWMSFLRVSNASVAGCNFPGKCAFRKRVGLGCAGAHQCTLRPAPADGLC